MRLCTDTITVINAVFDPLTDRDIYSSAIVSGVSWFGRIDTGIDSKGGLAAADSVVIRIPTSAVGNKSYVPVAAYADPATQWTVMPGTIVIRGIVSGADLSPRALFAAYGNDCRTVLGVTANDRGRAPHLRVVGK